MSDQPRSYQRFFAELKRRRVFRVMAVYGVVGFIILQIVDLAIPALLLPDWVYRFVALLLLLGFPIVLIVAWAFEITPEGFRKTEAAKSGEIEEIVAQPRLKRWPAGILALVGIVALVAGAVWFGRQTALLSDPEPSIAVLPFVNMSPDPDQEYFSEGISAELLNLLAEVPGLHVAARTSSFAFKGENLAIPVIADSLNVAHVLEGSVRKANGNVRIAAQLIRAEDGYQLWSGTWDRTLDDIFAIQDEIAGDVVEQLRVRLLDQPPTVEETDPEAYALVLRARHLTEQRTTESTGRAEELYRDALAIDPDYAPGWSGLAINYYRQGAIGRRSYHEGVSLAREAADSALVLDPDHAPAHTTLGLIEQGEGNLAAAARHHERALALDPGNARTVSLAAATLAALNRIPETIRLMEHQVDLDPVRLGGHANLGLAYIADRRWQDAIESLRTALELSPSAGGIRSLLGTVFVHAGDPETALEVIRDEPVEPWRLIALSMAQHALGRTTEADATLAELIKKYERDWAFNIAYVVAYRGEVDRAFEWLERAASYEDAGLSEIFVHPELRVLHDDPRWPAFLERIGRSPQHLAAIEFDVNLESIAAR